MQLLISFSSIIVVAAVNISPRRHGNLIAGSCPATIDSIVYHQVVLARVHGIAKLAGMSGRNVILGRA